VGCYGAQTADLNISLTAINLTCNISYFIANPSHSPVSSPLPESPNLEEKETPSLPETTRQRKEERVEREPSSQENGVSGKLWMAVFVELQTLTCDRRYEVRNCAAQTLLKTLGTHGDLLDQDTWDQCLWAVGFITKEKIAN
jgi:hypothetical protein